MYKISYFFQCGAVQYICRIVTELRTVLVACQTYHGARKKNDLSVHFAGTFSEVEASTVNLGFLFVQKKNSDDFIYFAGAELTLF